jgi:predicted ATPase
MNGLQVAVEDGLMDFDDDTSYFTFVHDSVREVAYGMMSPDTRDKFHFEIGLNLLNNCINQPEVKSQCLYAILDQINHGVPSLCDESQSISIAKLNLEAGLASMLQSNYTSGYNYAKSAVSLLPVDSWETRYDLCLRLYCLLAKTAYSCNQIDEAKSAANEIVEHASSPRDKLDGYAIQHYIVMNTCDTSDAGRLKSTILQLLESLGEHIPPNMSEESVESEVASAIEYFETHSDQDHVHMYTNVDTNNQAVIIRAYAILALLASITNPHTPRYYVARWIQFCLKYKVASKYIPAAYVSFASILCQDINKNMEKGHRVGKLGLKLLGTNSSLTMLPEVYVIYYGNVGVFFEPMQAVVEMHRKAFEVGYQVGDLSNSAFHKLFYAVRQFYAGANLVKLKEELEHGFKSEEYHCSFPMLGKKLHHLHTTVMRLIGDEETPIVSHPEPELEVFDGEPTSIVREMAYLMYRGHYERVTFMAKRWSTSSAENQWKLNLRSVYVCFYSCLSMLVIGRRKKPNKSKIDQLLSVLKLAAGHSAWNFKNKVALITAERLSLSKMNAEAEVVYCTAIETAHSSKFFHEEGLACELAGMHYERLKNIDRAVASFERAQTCYDIWGSQMKVRMMQEKIQNLSHTQTESSN